MRRSYLFDKHFYRVPLGRKVLAKFLENSMDISLKLCTNRVKTFMSRVFLKNKKY